MDATSAAIITQALDGLHQRYLASAHNIANASSEDFQPLRVSFEESLRQAASAGADAVLAVRPSTFVDETADGAMRLDLELANAAQTAARYRALIDILSRQMSLERAALGTGG